MENNVGNYSTPTLHSSGTFVNIRSFKQVFTFVYIFIAFW